MTTQTKRVGRPKSAVSIIEVAAAAGVSKSTVSRVINSDDSVRPSVAELVRQAMVSVGYRPPLRRRGPKRMKRLGFKTGNVALLSLHHHPADLYNMPVFPSLLRSLETALGDCNLNLVLLSIGPDGAMPPAIELGGIDGLLILGGSHTTAATLKQRLGAIPAVWLMRENSDEANAFDHVFYNNAAVGRIAARYLLARGHRRLAFINTATDHAALNQRQSDFTRAVAATGAACDLLVPNAASAPGTPASLAAMIELVDRLIKLPQRPTGIFIPNDAQLPWFYAIAQQRGIEPAKLFDVIACDNDAPSLRQIMPRPATIDLGLSLLGQRGFQQLVWRMKNPHEPFHVSVYIEPKLVEPEAGSHAAALGDTLADPLAGTLADNDGPNTNTL